MRDLRYCNHLTDAAVAERLLPTLLLAVSRQMLEARFAVGHLRQRQFANVRAPRREPHRADLGRSQLWRLLLFRRLLRSCFCSTTIFPLMMISPCSMIFPSGIPPWCGWRMAFVRQRFSRYSSLQRGSPDPGPSVHARPLSFLRAVADALTLGLSERLLFDTISKRARSVIERTPDLLLVGLRNPWLRPHAAHAGEICAESIDGGKRARSPSCALQTVQK